MSDRGMVWMVDLGAALLAGSLTALLERWAFRDLAGVFAWSGAGAGLLATGTAHLFVSRTRRLDRPAEPSGDASLETAIRRGRDA